MKIKDVIKMANLMEKGNVLEPELAMFFLSELDGMIQSDMMLHAPEEIARYDNQEQELLLRKPHDGIYLTYLVAMIRQCQGEFEGYNNAMESFDEKLKTFKRWYIQHYRPADTASRSYTGGTSADAFGFAYLTAYGLAVKHGYSGTEEEWLASLEGEPGAPGAAARMRFNDERGMIQWGVGEEWYDLFTLEELKDPVVEELMAQVRALLEDVEAAASHAADSEAAARGHAKTAADAAADALGSAGRAYASEQTAVTAAGDAQVQAETAQGYALRAEAAAERAEAAAGMGTGGNGSGQNPPQDGEDGFSPIATVTQAAGGATISITDKNGTTTATVTNGKDGEDGQPGKDGYTPQKGVDYFDGQPGKDGKDGADGYTPVKGVDYFDGQPGKDGVDGKDGSPGKDGADGNGIKSAVLNADYTLTLTFDDGTTYTTPSIRGATGAPGSAGKDGSDGAVGKDGTDGVGIASIKQTTTSTADGGNNVFTVTLDNGKSATFTVKNGSKGSTGATGPAGKDAETIPDYVRTEAETVARIVNQHQSSDSIVFPVLTDAHCGYYTDTENEATKLAGQLAYLIGKRVPFDFIANGGDASDGAWSTTREMTYEQYEDYTELIAEAHKGVPTVWAPGNHDDAPYMATADRATQRDMFALIGRKNRLSGAMCPNGCCYGYLDLENRKLRVIYLDTDDKRSWGTVQVGNGGTAPAYLNAHNVGGAQLRWLAEAALDFSGKANPAEWSIVVVSHVALDVSGTITDAVSGATYAHSTANAAALLNAYRLGKSGSITHNGVTVNYDFSTIENRAVVICAVHGHNHKFCAETLDGGIVSIGCPNVMNGRERVSDDGNTYTKTAGTADGTSFCIITIDREHCMIYADCVGAGYDREFEYTTEVVSYTNQLPISTDASGNIYNGKGWKENTYLSGGNDGAKNGTFATGFIPVAPAVNEYGTAYFYLKNVGMTNNQDGHRLCTYKADKTNIATYKTTIQGNPFVEYGSDGNISVIALAANVISTGVAYVRLCCGYLGEDSVITANEPIE